MNDLSPHVPWWAGPDQRTSYVAADPAPPAASPAAGRLSNSFFNREAFASSSGLAAELSLDV